MSTETDWGVTQDAAYHLERAMSKQVSTILFVGAGVLAAARAMLKESGDWVQMAHRDVEALAVKGKKKKEARAAVLKALKSAEKRGIDAAMLLFQEKMGAKDAVGVCAAISAAVALELEALTGLLAIRDATVAAAEPTDQTGP